VALIGGWFFYFRLAVDTIHVPFVGNVFIGWLIIPLFVLVVVATANAVNISDGLDGLAGVWRLAPLVCIQLSHFWKVGLVLLVLYDHRGLSAELHLVQHLSGTLYDGDVGSFALGTAFGRSGHAD